MDCCSGYSRCLRLARSPPIRSVLNCHVFCGFVVTAYLTHDHSYSRSCVLVTHCMSCLFVYLLEASAASTGPKISRLRIQSRGSIPPKPGTYRVRYEQALILSRSPVARVGVSGCKYELIAHTRRISRDEGRGSGDGPSRESYDQVLSVTKV
jgi:hypothetical protein